VRGLLDGAKDREDDREGRDDDLHAIADELIRAIHSKNPAAVVDAFKALQGSDDDDDDDDGYACGGNVIPRPRLRR
jgi:hypothetical protein